MVSLIQVNKYIDDHQALEAISLEVIPGEKM